MTARSRRGFGRIRKCQPSGRYQASYTAPDGLVYKAPNTFAAKVDAEAWLTDRRREIDRDLWSPPATPEQVEAKRKAETRFGQYANTWLETRTVRGQPLRPRSKAHYRWLLDTHVLPTFADVPIGNITMESVDQWYAATLPGKPTSRAHAYGLLRTILETARTRDRIIAVNPCMIRGAGTASRKIRPRPATLEQLDIIVSEMPDRLRLMVLLAAWCALRFGELVELRRRDIDTEEGVVRIRRAAVRVENGWRVGDPKSEAGIRDVAIPPHIMPYVTDHLTKHVAAEPDSLIFPAKEGGRLHPSIVQNHYYKARAKAKRTDLRFHDLRHSGAVLAAQAGATLAELMARVGHSTPQAAMRYQHQAQGRDRIIANALSEIARKRT